MKDIIFLPILKTKSRSEPLAIRECHDLFNTKIIPYIEIINDAENDKGYDKTKNAIGNLLHFEQFYRKKDSELLNIIEKSKLICNSNTISSIEIKKRDLDNDFDFSSIENFVNFIHNGNYSCSIRINTEIDIKDISKIFNVLSDNDYLIIDIEDNMYKSLMVFLKTITSIHRKCKIIIFSNERPTNSTNRDLAYDDYNNSFNTSVLDAIKNDYFIGDGFGSYCAARNDLTQSGTFKYPVYGVFVIYDFEKNNFFSYKTNKKEHISKVYSFLKPKLKDDELLSDFFSKTEISNRMLYSFLDNENKKGNAPTYISFSIVHYIEEICNNIY